MQAMQGKLLPWQNPARSLSCWQWRGASVGLLHDKPTVPVSRGESQSAVVSTYLRSNLKSALQSPVLPILFHAIRLACRTARTHRTRGRRLHDSCGVRARALMLLRRFARPHNDTTCLGWTSPTPPSHAILSTTPAPQPLHPNPKPNGILPTTRPPNPSHHSTPTVLPYLHLAEP